MQILVVIAKEERESWILFLFSEKKYMEIKLMAKN